MSKLTCEDDLYYLQWADKLRAYQEVLEWLEEGVFQPTPSEEKFKKQKSPATRAITKHQEPLNYSALKYRDSWSMPWIRQDAPGYHGGPHR